MELVPVAKTEELDAWRKFVAYEPRKNGSVSRQIAQARWVLTWKMMDGQKSAKARVVAKGYQDPDLQEGLVDTSG